MPGLLFGDIGPVRHTVPCDCGLPREHRRDKGIVAIAAGYRKGQLEHAGRCRGSGWAELDEIGIMLTPTQGRKPVFSHLFRCLRYVAGPRQKGFCIRRCQAAYRK
jgi:hypothetical protein